MGWVGLGWVGLGWVGLGWVGLGWLVGWWGSGGVDGLSGVQSIIIIGGHESRPEHLFLHNYRAFLFFGGIYTRPE